MALLSPDPTSCLRNNKCLSGPNRGLAYNALKPCPDSYIFDATSCDCSLPACRSGWVFVTVQNIGTSQLWQTSDCTGYGTYTSTSITTQYAPLSGDWSDVRITEANCTCGRFYKVEGLNCSTGLWQEITRTGCQSGFYGIKDDVYPWLQEYYIIPPP